MSWTEVFPAFTEEMVEEFQLSATSGERAEMEELYGVERIINPEEKPHIFSYSLFWKNVWIDDPALPQPTREIMKSARQLGIVERYDPWEHYVEPLLSGVPELRDQHPDVAFRVYLAHDLGFLVDDLAAAGCEVYYMQHSSLAFAPGGLWRYLAFGESEKLITVADMDQMSAAIGDMARTRAMAAEGLGAWRAPIWEDRNPMGQICYLPAAGCQCGVRGGWPMETLLHAFTWHCRRGSMPNLVEIPHCKPEPLVNTAWPDYGFDEWFWAAALYPRLATAGLLTFVPTSAHSQLLTLDIEYVTWANSSSQLVYFPLGSCCGGSHYRPGMENPTFVGLEEAAKDRSFSKPRKPPKFKKSSPLPNLSLLFLTLEDVNHPKTWQRWLDAAPNGRIQVFSHSKSEKLPEGAFLRGREIGMRVETEWGEVSLVRAHLALLRSALAWAEASHFMLLSENCVPARPATSLLDSLHLDPRPRIPWLSRERMTEIDPGKASRADHLPPGLAEHAVFHDQWNLLDRRAAMDLMENDYTADFEEMFASDESYVGTMLGVSGWNLPTEIVRRVVTWTKWANRDPSPLSYEWLPPETAAEIRESGCFFARKFPRGAAIDLLDTQAR